MRPVIKGDRAMMFAVQANGQTKTDVIHQHRYASDNAFMEPRINTVVDHKPQRPPVRHQRSPARTDLPCNIRQAPKQQQVWASSVHFPNAHAFPDNPLHTATDYLAR